MLIMPRGFHFKGLGYSEWWTLSLILSACQGKKKKMQWWESEHVLEIPNEVCICQRVSLNANSSLPLDQRSLSHYWDDELVLVKTPGVTSISLAESHLLTSVFWFRKQKVYSWEGRLHSFICLHIERINTFMRAWDKLLWFQTTYVCIKNPEEFVKCKFPVLLSKKYNPEGL